MTAITFDTLQASKALQGKGFSREQAEALAEMQRSALEGFAKDRELATKRDLAELKNELLRWIFGMLAGFAALLLAAMKWIH